MTKYKTGDYLITTNNLGKSFVIKIICVFAETYLTDSPKTGNLCEMPHSTFDDNKWWSLK